MANLVIDVLYGFLDPRVVYPKKERSQEIEIKVIFGSPKSTIISSLDNL